MQTTQKSSCWAFNPHHPLSYLSFPLTIFISSQCFCLIILISCITFFKFHHHHHLTIIITIFTSSWCWDFFPVNTAISIASARLSLLLFHCNLINFNTFSHLTFSHLTFDLFSLGFLLLLTGNEINWMRNNFLCRMLPVDWKYVRRRQQDFCYSPWGDYFGWTRFYNMLVNPLKCPQVGLGTEKVIFVPHPVVLYVTRNSAWTRAFFGCKNLAKRQLLVSFCVIL